jgi:MFS transporter, DHA3 family, macrolide efflux protein
VNHLRSGLAGFFLVGAGQLVSMAGSAMSGLALSVWAWQETGQATTLSLLVFFRFAPEVLLSPLAGDLIDRWPKKLTMMFSDLGAGVSTIVTLLLLANGRLELWHLYALAVWSGAFGAFQVPAFASAVPSMVSEKHYARANGTLALAQAGANVLAPALAGVLLAFVGIRGVLLIDVLTFSAAILTLWIVRIPNLRVESNQAESPTFWSRLTYGFRYISARPPLRTLAVLYVFISIIGAVGMVLLAPLVLARSGGSEVALGSVMAALGAGGVVGGLVMSAWGGPKNRMHGILAGLFAVSVFGYGVTGLAITPLMATTGAFCITLFLPLIVSSHQVIWQTYVPRDVQGRVFAARQALGQGTMPVVMLGAGPLADALSFNPALHTLFGPGAGIVVLFLTTALLGILVVVVCLALPSVRRVEERLLRTAVSRG